MTRKLIIFDSALNGDRFPARGLRKAIEAANSYDEHLLCEEFAEFLTIDEKNEILTCLGVLTDDQEEVIKSDVAQALLNFQSSTP